MRPLSPALAAWLVPPGSRTRTEESLPAFPSPFAASQMSEPGGDVNLSKEKGSEGKICSKSGQVEALEGFLELAVWL